MDDRATKLKAFCEALDGQRRPWDGLWQELADVVHPRRSLIAKQTTTPDRQKLAEAFDGTAMRANRTLANGQAARITPMGARWFGLRPAPDLADNAVAIRYFQQCGEILAGKLAASNFYNRAHEHYLDRGAFGIAATEVTSGKNQKGLHFRSYPVGSYSVAHDAQDEVDTLCRTFQMRPAQLLELFPYSAPECVRKMQGCPNEALTPLDIKHLVRPREDRDPRKTDDKNKPYESIYLLMRDGTILSESGYDSFPVAVSRWELWGESPYGWAPSYLALPEASQANFLEQMLDTLAELSAFPRVLYPSNLKGDVDFRSLGLTCYDPTNGHEPKEWLTNGRYDVGKDRANDKRKAIDEAFFVPLFNAISQLNRDATATEVRAIVSESRELFHPIFANLTREFLRPVLHRSFSILLAQGELPPPPPEILKKTSLGVFMDNPEVEYTSSMALALEQSQLANFADCVNTLAPLALTDPSVWDFMDMEQIGPAFFRYKGLPANFVRSADAVAEIRSSRAQAQQAAAAEQAAGAVQKLGGAQGMQDLQGLSMKSEA
jgi:hypothetical protein